MSTLMSRAEVDNIFLDLTLCRTAEQMLAWKQKYADDLSLQFQSFTDEIAQLTDDAADADGLRGIAAQAAEYGEQVKSLTKDLGSVFNDLEETIRKDVLPYKILQELENVGDTLEDLKP